MIYNSYKERIYQPITSINTVLKLNQLNMEKRSIKIDIDTARKWYLSRDSFKQELALQVFTKEELELPKSWNEFKNSASIKDTSINFNVIELIAKLVKLRDVYRKGWKPNWNNKNEYKWVITIDEEIEIFKYYRNAHLFSFPTKELAEQFLENFKEELEQLKELL